MIKTFSYDESYIEFSSNSYIVGKNNKPCIVIDLGTTSNDVVNYVKEHHSKWSEVYEDKCFYSKTN